MIAACEPKASVIQTVEGQIGLLVTPAAQGPAGPPGAPGVSGGAGSAYLTLTASQNLQGGYGVTADVATPGAAKAPTTPTLAEAQLFLGVTLGAAAQGAEVQIQGSGELTDTGWSWTPGALLFLGPLGLPTQTPPTSGVCLVIGIALSPTTILIRPQPPIALT
jgi:hypothetical protein